MNQLMYRQTDRQVSIVSDRQVDRQTDAGVVYLHFHCLPSVPGRQGFWVHRAVCHLQEEEGFKHEEEESKS